MIRFWRRVRDDRDPLVCREFVDLVSDYLDAHLAASERARFEAHLAECDGCTSYLQDMRRMVDSLHKLPEPPQTRSPTTRCSRPSATYGVLVERQSPTVRRSPCRPSGSNGTGTYANRSTESA